VPIDSDKYSDVGYRYRTNVFYNFKEWYPFAEEVISFDDPILFYDFKFFNQDTYVVPVVPSSEKSLIAEIYFRLEIDQISHERVVYGFFDWLESMGGVPEILKSIASLMVGGYLAFHASLTNMGYLYTLSSKHKTFGESGEDDEVSEGSSIPESDEPKNKKKKN